MRQEPYVHLRGNIHCTAISLAFLVLQFSTRSVHAEPKDPAITVQSATKDALAQGLRVTGSVLMHHTSSNTGNSTVRYLERIVRLKISNHSGMPVGFGDDLVIMEMDKDLSEIGGSLVMFNRKESSYGYWMNYGEYRTYGVSDFQSYIRGDLIGDRAGGSSTSLMYAFYFDPQVFPRPLSEGEQGWIFLNIAQGSWVADSDRTKVCLGLPEIRIDSPDSPKRFRGILDLKAAGEGAMRWEAGEVRWIPIEPAGLAELAASSRENTLVRIMAANWLSDAFPDDAVALIRSATPTLQDGPLAGSYLALAARLKIDGLIPLAMRILGDVKAGNAARRAAIDYIAAYSDTEGVAALERLLTTEGTDFFVRKEAAKALAQPGNAAAAAALMRVLAKTGYILWRDECAKALARTGVEEGRKFLMEAAERKDEWGIEGLANSGDAGMFEYFSKQATVSETNGGKLSPHVLRGLRLCGSRNSLPILLKFVEKHKEAEKPDGYGSLATAAAEELGQVDGPEAVAALASLARNGNHSAVAGLAKSDDPSARLVLEEIVRRGPGQMRMAALSGLEEHWAAESSDLLLEILKVEDKEARKIALRALAQTGDPRAVEQALTLCRSGEDDGRLLAEFPLRDHLPEVFEILLEKQDSRIAGALLQHGFEDATALSKLRQHVVSKMKEKDDINLYGSLFLLRTLSGSSLGPDHFYDYLGKKREWNQQWAEWCRKHP